MIGLQCEVGSGSRCGFDRRTFCVIVDEMTYFCHIIKLLHYEKNIVCVSG